MENGTWIIRKNSENEVFIEDIRALNLKGGIVEVNASTPTWLTLRAGTSGVNVKSHTDANKWLPISASAFNVTSSKTVKENIAELTDEEAKKLLNLRPVSFDYKDDAGGQKNQYGLIAEEVESIIPFAVTIPEDYDELNFDVKNGVPSIDYSKFVPYLIKMVQIQQCEIQKLKEELS